jgi:hypothetical protein
MNDMARYRLSVEVWAPKMKACERFMNSGLIGVWLFLYLMSVCITL